MSGTNRTPRELETRAEEARVEYTPAALLPTPNPEPGYSFRWIATHNMGDAMPVNVSRKRQEGWEPVRAEDHPELKLPIKSGNIEISGLMLCKMPTERVQARARYYNKFAERQMESVDGSYMQQNDPRMPKFRKTKTSVSRGGFGNGS